MHVVLTTGPPGNSAHPQHTLFFFLRMIQFLSKDKTEFPAIVSSESGPLQSTVT